MISLSHCSGESFRVLSVFAQGISQNVCIIIDALDVFSLNARSVCSICQSDTQAFCIVGERLYIDGIGESS